jgi:hypothetical protein
LVKLSDQLLVKLLDRLLVKLSAQTG